MEREVALSDPSDVTDALLSSSLVPPPPPPSIGGGSTARLRDAMARFSSGSDHAHRRRSVDATVHLIGSFPFERAALKQTEARLDASRTDVVRDIGFVVPCEVVASALGVPEPLLPAVLTDVEAVVAVIGRGAPASPTSDGAAERLAATLAGTAVGTKVGPVPAVSLLYETFDATSALITTTIMAMHSHARRAAAVTRTKRVAVADVTIGSRRINPGAEIVLDLASAGLEFGTGPHACPGRAIAEAMTGGVVRALTSARYDVADDVVQLASNGVPTRLPMQRRRA